VLHKENVCQAAQNSSTQAKTRLPTGLKMPVLVTNARLLLHRATCMSILTKLKPATVKLPMTDVIDQDNFLSNKMRFMELLETLGNFDIQS
jgi:hypothetical protein